jgi:hypothetical protein
MQTVGVIIFTRHNSEIYLVSNTKKKISVFSHEMLPSSAVELSEAHNGCQYSTKEMLFQIGLAYIPKAPQGYFLIKLTDCIRCKSVYITPVLYFWQRMLDYKESHPLIFREKRQSSFSKFIQDTLGTQMVQN